MVAQPKKNSSKKKVTVRKRIVKPVHKKMINHPKYGTSKLEDRFAEQFLDKLGVKYTRQFEAKGIGRFYDFMVQLKHGGVLLIEIDGSWYHSDPRLVNEEDMNPMQKKNRRVDEHKNEWALLHGIPLLRIWEKDINENPSGVLKALKERFYIEDKKVLNEENKNKKHRRIKK